MFLQDVLQTLDHDDFHTWSIGAETVHNAAMCSLSATIVPLHDLHSLAQPSPHLGPGHAVVDGKVLPTPQAGHCLWPGMVCPVEKMDRTPQVDGNWSHPGCQELSLPGCWQLLRDCGGCLQTVIFCMIRKSDVTVILLQTGHTGFLCVHHSIQSRQTPWWQ